jgi:transposase
VGSDEPVIGTSEVRRLEDRVRELECLLGRKTLENEILRDALAKSKAKEPILRPLSLLSHCLLWLPSVVQEVSDLLDE